MSFSSEIKKEILSKERNNSSKKAFLYAVFVLKSEIKNNTIYLKKLSKGYIKPLSSFLKDVFKKEIKNGKPVIKDAKLIIDEFDLNNKNSFSVKFFYSDLEISSFLSGIFLSRGSINNPEKPSYHFEIVLDTFNQAKFIRDLLEEKEIEGRIIERKKGFIYYVKKAEQIGDFIKILEATSSLFKYEDARITKDLGNMVNRINNCDITNAVRAYKSAQEQLENIKIIEIHQGYESLSTRLMEAVILRSNYPEASLQELSEESINEIGVFVSKSSLNHRFREIKEMALKYKNKDN
ncbi:MAG: DNA-binding protein WhiA [Bacilli bacterium]